MEARAPAAMVELQRSLTQRVSWRQDRAGLSPTVVNTRPALHCTLRLALLGKRAFVLPQRLWHSQLAHPPSDSPVTRGVISGHVWADCGEQFPAAEPQCTGGPPSPVAPPLCVPQALSLPWPSPKHAVYPGVPCVHPFIVRYALSSLWSLLCPSRR